MKRSPKGDKVHKDRDRKIYMEYLGFICKCGAKWRQIIDYRNSAAGKVTWRKME